MRAGTVLNHYAHIFELLSKLRQGADHPFLITHKQATKDNVGAYVCGLCHDVAEEPVASKCKHVFCREDIRQYMESYMMESTPAECPVCFTRLSINLDQAALPPRSFQEACEKKPTSIVERMLNASAAAGEDGLPTWSSSTKMEALLEELDKLRRMDRTIK